MKKMILFLMCSLQLTSGNINWSFPPEAISSAGQTANHPQIAIDPNGNAIAIWIENNLIKSKAKPADMGWSSETILSAFGGSFPSIVCDNNGNATAVWLENGVVKSASKTLSGAWSSVSTLSGNNASSPCIAIDSDGDVIVAWARNGDIQTTTKLFGGNWQNVVTINATSSAKPHIAIGGTGSNTRAAVVWQGVASQVNVVYGASKLLSNSSWGGKQIISDTAHQAGFAKTAVDPKGNVVAVWFSYDVSGGNFSRVLVQTANKMGSGEWVNFSTLSSPGIGDVAKLSLEVGCDVLGNTIALWNTTFDNETFTVQSAVKPAYGNWTAPIDLVSDNLYSYNSRLSLASLGNAIALYMFYNGVNVLIQSSELDITGFIEAAWSLPLTLSEASANAKPYIACAVNSDTIHTAAIWLASTGMNNSAIATVGNKSIPTVPNNLSVVQNSTSFGVFTEYYNILNWEASSDPNVAGYLIFRNGLFLARVDSETFEYVDHNQVQNKPVVYGVASLDDQDVHGEIATISFP